MCAVVLVHVCARLFDLYEVGSTDWLIVDVLDSLARWAVPCFLMASGALMLDGAREVSLRDLWLRRIPRLTAVYVVWSCLYALYHVLDGGWPGWGELLAQVVRGEYHLWFLPMFTVVTALLPLLRAIAKDERLLNYACALFVTSTLVSYVPFVEGGLVGGAVSSLLADAHVPVLYAGYCLLGHRLSTLELHHTLRALLYGAGALGALACVMGTYALSTSAGTLVTLYDNLTPNVLALSCTAFVLARRTGEVLARRGSGVAERFARLSLGVYLVHPLFIYVFFETMATTVLAMSPWLALAWAALISMLAWVVARVVSVLPGLKSFV